MAAFDDPIHRIVVQPGVIVVGLKRLKGGLTGGTGLGQEAFGSMGQNGGLGGNQATKVNVIVGQGAQCLCLTLQHQTGGDQLLGIKQQFIAGKCRQWLVG